MPLLALFLNGMKNDVAKLIEKNISNFFEKNFAIKVMTITFALLSTRYLPVETGMIP